MKIALAAVCLFLQLLAVCQSYAQTPSEDKKSQQSNVEAEQEELLALEKKQNALLEELRQKVKELRKLAANPQTAPSRRATALKLIAEFEATEKKIATPPIRRSVQVLQDTADPLLAAYMSRMIIRIEDEGTRRIESDTNPERYGAGVLSITLNKIGEVINIQIEEVTNQYIALQLTRLVKDLQPFEPLGTEIGKDVHAVVFTVRFQFSAVSKSHDAN